MTGWSLKRINREAYLREWASYGDDESYHPLRDGPRKQDWTWAVDEMHRAGELAPDSHTAAHDFYRAQQAARGDVERRETPRVDGGGERFSTAIWARLRATSIEGAALSFVWARPENTPMRWATFCYLFHWRQPTLAEVRIHGRVGGPRRNAQGAWIRLNEGETKYRIQWCCDTLALHFADMTRGYGP